MAMLMHGTLPAAAQKWERLIMPGPVIQGHAEFENTCSKCHEPFKKTKQKQLCVACHKDIGGDIRESKGFHGRIKKIETTRCRTCHTEHKGRDADIVLLDQETFDHRQTDFKLSGAHSKVACASCHKPGKKHRAAPSVCVDCHRNDDPHKGRLGNNCTDCHGNRSWREVKFDHTRRTKFTLSGKHAELSCKQCHVGERYKYTPTKCHDCHRLNDVHGGRFGAKCDKCHATEDWKKARFNHDQDTKFRLHGSHRKLECTACHRGPLSQQKNKKHDCRSCHVNDDVHKGRNGPDCAACHQPNQWKTIKFDHDRDTKFPLRQKHKTLKCESCHKGSIRQEKLGTRCYDCHRTDDVHKNRLGQRCENCHRERGWAENIRFDHDLTPFPLIGQHAVVPCEECHVSQVFKGAPRACAACHADDDPHKKRLGTNCQSCHNPNGWAFWRFDHNSQTDFKLDGAHENLKCEACHTRPIGNKVRMTTVCGDCHRRDDIHRGTFTQSCDQCHSTKSFKELRLRQ